MRISRYSCWSDLLVHVSDFKMEVPAGRMCNSAGPSLKMERGRVWGFLVLVLEGDRVFAGTSGLDGASLPQRICESFAP